MYRKDDVVTYGAQGVCRIIGITEKDFNGQRYSYYELQPVYDQRSTVFIPVENQTLTGKMHRILSAAAVDELIQSVPSQQTVWIEDEGQRRQRYKELVATGDREGLIRAVKALYLYQQKQKAAGKKIHVCDERFLKEAEKLLYDEFAFVLQIDRSEVAAHIMGRITEQPA